MQYCKNQVLYIRSIKVSDKHYKPYSFTISRSRILSPIIIIFLKLQNTLKAETFILFCRLSPTESVKLFKYLKEKWKFKQLNWANSNFLTWKFSREVAAAGRVPKCNTYHLHWQLLYERQTGLKGLDENVNLI